MSYGNGRNGQLIRQWNLLRDIHASRWSTIPNFASKYEVSTKTIRRDLKALEAAGFPLYVEHGEEGHEFYWRLAAADRFVERLVAGPVPVRQSVVLPRVVR